MAVRIPSRESNETIINPPSSPSLLRRLSGIAQGHLPRTTSNTRASFTPPFDLEEHQHTYELYGELAGAKRERINVKTIDPHSIEVFGNVVRHSVETQQADLVLTPTNELTDPYVKIWTPELASPRSQSPEMIFRPNSIPETLDEEYEEDGGILTKTHGRAYIYAEADNEMRRKEAALAEPFKVKHIITECQVGDFYRKFHFPTSIRMDAVTARFEDGVLHVTLPKEEA